MNIFDAIEKLKEGKVIVRPKINDRTFYAQAIIGGLKQPMYIRYNDKDKESLDDLFRHVCTEENLHFSMAEIQAKDWIYLD